MNDTYVLEKTNRENTTRRLRGLCSQSASCSHCAVAIPAIPVASSPSAIM